MDWIPLDTCLCCGNTNLSLVIDLGEQVPANAVHDGTKPQERYPLRMMRCRDCSHMQLDRSVDPEILYRDYPYSTGVSASMVKHLEGLAAGIGTGRRVLEIGANDGTLLEIMQNNGCDVVGLEPSTSFANIHQDKKVFVLCGMWSEWYASGLIPNFDVVVGTNVLAHLRDPKAALRACGKVLKPGGHVIFEVHAGESVILRKQFDTIYHEHLSYFTSRSAARLAEGTPFNLVDATPIDAHGGSWRFTFSRDTTRCDGTAIELCDPKMFAGYAHSIRDRGDTLLAVLRSGCVMVGASARATVMLQSWNPPVAAAVDDAPLKIGKLIAGTSIPIMPFDWLHHNKPKQVLLGAWNLYGTFRPRLAELLPGAELISYQPEVKVEVL